jgi:hypothetical protein
MPSGWQPRPLGLSERTDGGQYIPHPAPHSAGSEDDDVKMGLLSVLKVGRFRLARELY